MKSDEVQWSKTQNRTRQKTFCGRERPHFWREYHAKIPSGFGGRSRPQCVRLAGELPSYPASAVPKVPARTDRRCSHARPRVQPRRTAHASTETARTHDRSAQVLLAHRGIPRSNDGTLRRVPRHCQHRPCCYTGSAIHLQTRQPVQVLAGAEPGTTSKPVKPKASSNSAASDGGAQ